MKIFFDFSFQKLEIFKAVQKQGFGFPFIFLNMQIVLHPSSLMDVPQMYFKPTNRDYESLKMLLKQLAIPWLKIIFQIFFMWQFEGSRHNFLIVSVSCVRAVKVNEIVCNSNPWCKVLKILSSEKSVTASNGYYNYLQCK